MDLFKCVVGDIVGVSEKELLIFPLYLLARRKLRLSIV